MADTTSEKDGGRWSRRGMSGLQWQRWRVSEACQKCCLLSFVVVVLGLMIRQQLQGRRWAVHTTRNFAKHKPWIDRLSSQVLPHRSR